MDRLSDVADSAFVLSKRIVDGGINSLLRGRGQQGAEVMALCKEDGERVVEVVRDTDCHLSQQGEVMLAFGECGVVIVCGSGCDKCIGHQATARRKPSA